VFYSVVVREWSRSSDTELRRAEQEISGNLAACGYVEVPAKWHMEASRAARVRRYANNPEKVACAVARLQVLQCKKP